jgi:hypothetical protein
MTFKTLLLSSFALALASPALAQQSGAPQAGQTMPMPGAAQGQRQSPFERLDTNNDGVITRDEVRVLRTATFTRLDTNRDGFLVHDEMAAGMAAMGQNGGRRGPGGGREGGGLAAADTNRDGAVSRAEFDVAMDNVQARRNDDAQANRTRVFTMLDTNRDGALSNAEIAARPGHGMGKHGPAMGDAPAAPPPGRGGGMAALDTNNDKKISLAEWLARPEPLFERGDANNDGRVTREEAAAIVRQGRGGDGRPNRPW